MIQTNLQNTPMTNDVLYQNTCARLYHEDNLLSQRTAIFLTVQAFLATGLSVMVSSKTVTNPSIIDLMPVFGIVLAFFHFTISSRNMRSIEFFRAYISLLESNLDIKVDKGLYEFYNSGLVVTKFGMVGKRTTKESNISETFPWNTRFLNSSLQVIAIWLPFSIGVFWSVTAAMISSVVYLYVFPALFILLTIIRIFQLGHFFSAKPIPLSHSNYNLYDLIMPLPELIDRLIISEIKSEKINDEECKKEYKKYENVYKYYQEIGVHIDGEIYTNLKDIHLKIWELENDIRKGLDRLLSNDQIADRTLRIRDLNKKRVLAKNAIALKYKFPLEVKYNHASQ